MAGRFNLSDYETVKTRKDRFAEDHPDGVIIAIPQQVTAEEAYFTVALWDSREDYERGADRLAEAATASTTDIQALLLMAPSSLGTAYEAKWMTGASKTSWTENAEESAIGRALDNRGYHGGGKCSREEIQKVQRAEAALSTGPQEDPTSDGEAAIDLSQFPAWKALVEAMTGKKGVRELREVVMIAALLGYDEERLSIRASELGLDFEAGEKIYVQAIKLRDALKHECAAQEGGA